MIEMDIRKKKITAAVSAVIQYLQEEEAVLYTQSALALAPEEISAPEPYEAADAAEPEPALFEQPPVEAIAGTVTVDLWAASGRQSQMQIRNLMQLRAFSRF